MKESISKVSLVICAFLLLFSALVMSAPGGSVGLFCIMGVFAVLPIGAGPKRYRVIGIIALLIAIALVVSDYNSGRVWHKRYDEYYGWYMRARPSVNVTLQECYLPEAWLQDANSTPVGSLLPLQLHYDVDSYIQVAMSLQTLDHKAAIERLRVIARDRKLGDKVIPLCRMLFTRHAGVEFRRAGIGGGSFPGGTNYGDWPLDPIEIIDGVPFLITWGGLVAGFPEPAEKYLDYCLATCDWNAVRFTPKTAAEKRQAVDKLMASPKWRRPLDESEREFFAKQITDVAGDD